MFPRASPVLPRADTPTTIPVSEQGLLTQIVHGFQGSLLLVLKISGSMKLKNYARRN